MHPHIMAWWARHRGSEAVCHPGGGGFAGHHRGFHGPRRIREAAPSTEGGGFGVRRPLRFLAHKLDLTEKQAAAVAKILDELKTERAQGNVDERRTASAFAAAFENPQFDVEGAALAAERRVESAKRLRDAVVKSLTEIHALLDDSQRGTFAYLIRTGVLSI